MDSLVKSTTRKRKFIPNELKISVWSKIKPYYSELLKRPLNSLSHLEEWIQNMDELDAIVNEDFHYRYIKVSVDTSDEKADESYKYFIEEISPKLYPIRKELKEKLMTSRFLDSLNPSKYGIYLKRIKNSLSLYNEKNIPLFTQEKILASEYGVIISKIMVNIDGEEMTYQKARSGLESEDRSHREKVYRAIGKSFLAVKKEVNEVLDKLLEIRDSIAKNAGFDNYRDYKFKALGRFDYTPDDCMQFHESVKAVILPIAEKLDNYRLDSLQYDQLKLWDGSKFGKGNVPIKVYDGMKDLVEKSKTCLTNTHPFFGETLTLLKDNGHLDLESRENKRPGGYNMPLPMTGMPFIFMNANSSFRDIKVLMHETGHAVQSCLMNDLDLVGSMSIPSEIAELAAMSMELLTIDKWQIFFEENTVPVEAKINYFAGIVQTLLWIVTIDKFQHWLYTNVGHTADQREEAWTSIYNEFNSSKVDRTGFEEQLENLWQRQLHIFEVPFYYIEYGFAQLGALAIWDKYKEDPVDSVKDYMNALKQGYTQSIQDTYQAAGIEFNFDKEYIQKLGAVLEKEVETLYN